MAGGTMSILRRKGKQFKDRRGNEKENRGAKFNYELLSGDIHTLLQVFHDEANGGEVSQSSTSCSSRVPTFLTIFRCEIGLPQSKNQQLCGPKL